ncbi:MAG: 3-isopropylmalate dehydrogenase [Phycisphaerales bacterium]
MNATICLLPGDGIGPEITAEAVRTLEAIADRFGHTFTFVEALVGGAAMDATGEPLPAATASACASADAVLLGAVGGPKWDDPNAPVRPEQGLLALRKHLGVFANIRPVRAHAALAERSPLRQDLVAGVDLVIVRELTGGVYFGRRETAPDYALDECRYTTAEIERVARVACRIASARSGRLASLDKANVLDTSRLWRRTVERVVRDEFPGLALEHVLIDSAAMHLVTNPARFDVVVTENMFGDIISDESSVLCGSIGLLGSASLGESGPGLFEPIHGSAPDIAGRGTANPLGTIASAAMLCRLGLGLGEEGDAIDAAIDAVVGRGDLTPDLGGSMTTADVGRAVAARVLADRERALASVTRSAARPGR